MCAHMFVSNNANTRTYGPNTTTRLTRKQCQMAMAEDFCVIPPAVRIIVWLPFVIMRATATALYIEF